MAARRGNERRANGCGDGASRTEHIKKRKKKENVKKKLKKEEKRELDGTGRRGGKGKG